MGRMTRVLGILALAFSFIAVKPAHSEISHLELGAANYYADSGDHPDRFKILELTVQDLIAKYGESGTIYLNDIIPEGLMLACGHLREWLELHRYSKIQVIPLVGNYFEIDLPIVKTAHLSNPDFDQLPVFDRFSVIDAAKLNARMTRRLEEISDLSETGLTITTYMHHHRENPIAKLSRQLSHDFLMLQTRSNGYPYFFSNGRTLEWYKNDGNAEAALFERTETATFTLFNRRMFSVCELPLLGVVYQ